MVAKIQILIIMGNYISNMDDEVSTLIQADYHIQQEPYLLHKKTQQLCTLLKITAKSPQEADVINQVVEQYQRTKCESISKLRSHYHTDHTGYCSDEQNFYLVFEGQNNYTIREEMNKRRQYRTPFSDHQIEQILTTTLCGLREYDMRFQRHYERLSLNNLVIDQRNNRISLKDPWLSQLKPSKNSDRPQQAIAEYPSPQKLNASYADKMAEYNQSLSNLFSVGVMALELNSLDAANQVYIKKREINHEEIKRRVQQMKGWRLRQGVESLLNVNPEQRKKIYNIWSIQNKQEHFLQPILFQRGESVRPPSLTKPQAYNRTSKFQFPPKQSPKQPLLQYAPSQLIVIPPLQMNGPMTPTFNPPSTRSHQAASPRHLTFPITSLNQGMHQKTNAFPIPPNGLHVNLPPAPQYYGGNFQPQARSISNNKSPSAVIESAPIRFQQILARQQQKNSLKQGPVVDQNRAGNIRYEQSDLNQVFNLAANYPQKPTTQPLYKYRNPLIFSEPPKDIAITSFMTQQRQNGFANGAAKKIQSRNTHQATANILPVKFEVADQEVNKTPKLEKRDSNQQDNIESSAQKVQNKKPQPKANYAIKKDEESNITPIKPIARAKYNSTIVEARDEDSPAHSPKSEPRQEQYVVEEYETGSRYQGFKSGGMRNGRGKFFYQDGGFYQGSWRNNKMDGFGRLFYEGGKLAYEGQWLQDEFHGTGKVYNDCPALLSGPFDYTDFELLQDYWEYYQGTLLKDTKEGRGKILLSNGQLFEGDFHNDRIQGFGKFHTIDGKTIEGIWRDSKLVKVINSSKG